MTKDDRSPVTVADYASQAVIAHMLTQRLGPTPLVAEETSGALRNMISQGNTSVADAVVDAVRIVWPDARSDDVLDAIDIGGAEPADDDLHGFWTLDPIDGTKGFLRGEQYAISIAWIETGSPVVGVLGCPNLSKDFGRPIDEPDPHGVMYCAIAGRGLSEVVGDDAGAKPIAITRLVPAEGEPIRLCESVESSHTSHDDAERILEALGEPAEPLRLDSQAKYAVVARGQADLYLRLPKRGASYVERIWDHAAGSLVAIEAGCAVTDIAGRALDFGRGRGLARNRGVVVAMPRLHGLIMDAAERFGIGREAWPER